MTYTKHQLTGWDSRQIDVPSYNIGDIPAEIFHTHEKYDEANRSDFDDGFSPSALAVAGREP